MTDEEYIRNFLDYLRTERGRAESYLESCATDLHSFSSFLRAIDQALTLPGADTDLVRRWLAARVAGGVKPQSMKRKLSALRTFYKYLLLKGVVARTPMSGVGNPRSPRPLPVFARQEEMDRLFDDISFPDNFFGRRDRLMLLTFYSAGLRRGELIGLDVSGVSLENSTFRVLGKGSKTRLVPFGPELHEALSAYMAERAALCGSNEGPLFVGARFTRITPSQVAAVVRRYLSLVTTLPRRSPHVLRHTFATVMLNNGADLEAIRRLLGHESVSTTQIYTHAAFADLAKTYSSAHPRGRIVADTASADDEPPVS